VRKEQKIVFFGKTTTLLPEDTVPQKRMARKTEWLEALKAIPKGTAIAITREQFRMSPTNVKIMVLRLKKDKLLPKSYYTTGRTINGKETVYVVHSAKGEDEASEE
jgi:hypothetical protein